MGAAKCAMILLENGRQPIEIQIEFSQGKVITPAKTQYSSYYHILLSSHVSDFPFWVLHIYQDAAFRIENVDQVLTQRLPHPLDANVYHSPTIIGILHVETGEPVHLPKSTYSTLMMLLEASDPWVIKHAAPDVKPTLLSSTKKKSTPKIKVKRARSETPSPRVIKGEVPVAKKTNKNALIWAHWRSVHNSPAKTESLSSPSQKNGKDEDSSYASDTPSLGDGEIKDADDIDSDSDVGEEENKPSHIHRNTDSESEHDSEEEEEVEETEGLSNDEENFSVENKSELNEEIESMSEISQEEEEEDDDDDDDGDGTEPALEEEEEEEEASDVE